MLCIMKKHDPAAQKSWKFRTCHSKRTLLKRAKPKKTLCKSAQSKCTWTSHKGTLVPAGADKSRSNKEHPDRTPRLNTHRKIIAWGVKKKLQSCASCLLRNKGRIGLTLTKEDLPKLHNAGRIFGEKCEQRTPAYPWFGDLNMNTLDPTMKLRFDGFITETCRKSKGFVSQDFNIATSLAGLIVPDGQDWRTDPMNCLFPVCVHSCFTLFRRGAITRSGKPKLQADPTLTQLIIEWLNKSAYSILSVTERHVPSNSKQRFFCFYVQKVSRSCTIVFTDFVVSELKTSLGHC